jgi:transposase
MTQGNIASAKRRLGDGMSPREVVNHLGVSLSMLDRKVSASSRHAHSGGDL